MTTNPDNYILAVIVANQGLAGFENHGPELGTVLPTSVYIMEIIMDRLGKD